jgi:hypothetical protein
VRLCGGTLAECLLERVGGIHVVGMDNLILPGAETNRMPIERPVVEFIRGDPRSAGDIAGLPPCEWVIDATANPSLLAGLSGTGSSRRLLCPEGSNGKSKCLLASLEGIAEHAGNQPDWLEVSHE